MANELECTLAAGALPDLAALRRRFAPAQAAIPDVTVTLPALASYNVLLGSDLADVQPAEALA